MRRAILTVAGLALFGAGPTRAENYKVGDKVVVINDSVKVKVGNDVVDSVGRGMNFVVREVQGESIEISRVIPGFIDKQHVIPFDQSIGYWSGLIRANPKDAWAYAARAQAWEELKELDKAIKDYGECLRLEPKNGAAYAWRASAWHAKGEYDIAIADYNECIRLDSSSREDRERAMTYLNRGNTWTEKWEFGKAIADFNEAIRLDPKHAVAHNARAWLCATCPEARHRDGKKAVESATRGCELTGWKDPLFIDTLGAAYAEAGDFDAAVKWQTKAIELTSHSFEEYLPEFRSRLELFQQRKPYREDVKK